MSDPVRFLTNGPTDPQSMTPVSATNPLPVTTGGGVVSENLTQIAGNPVDSNSGVKSAGTLRVVLATDQPTLTNPIKVEELATAVTDRSGTVTLGGTAQQVMAANAARFEAWAYNLDAGETLWINFSGGNAAASAAGSIEVPPGTGWAGKVAGAVSLLGATTGHKFTAGER